MTTIHSGRENPAGGESGYNSRKAVSAAPAGVLLLGCLSALFLLNGYSSPGEGEFARFLRAEDNAAVALAGAARGAGGALATGAGAVVVSDAPGQQASGIGGAAAAGGGGDFFASAEWCQPPKSPPLPYEDCPNKDVVYKYGVYGGMTNALNFLLRGVVHAFEDGVCLTIDQTGPIKYAPMATRDAPEENVKNFLGRYFEPIGLPWGGDSSPEGRQRHPIAQKAKKIFFSYPAIGDREGKRLQKAQRENGGKRAIPRVDGMAQGLDNVVLKKGMLRRYWRLRPYRREAVCRRLSTHGIDGPYMAFSIRRGDKKIEHDGISEKTTVQQYIDEAEKAIQSHFGGRVPTVFVATDDCAAVDELRSLRPGWKFVSECDRLKDGSAAGFVLDDMARWTLEQTDAHYEKFFAELIAMAEAEFWIGVSFSNVAFWVYYMRHYSKGDDTVVFLDSPGFEDHIKRNM